jgi:predicted permease
MPGVDPQAALAWVDAFPLYAQIGWGLGVWGGLLGGLLLLLRSRWAVWALGASMIGAIAGLGYQILLAPPLAGAEGPMMTVIPYVIILVTIILFLYARAQAGKGVLR